MTNKIAFVLGAGASKEIGLPTGEELKKTISSMLDIRFEGGMSLSRGDADIAEALSIYAARHNENRNSYYQAARQISGGLVQAPSIDNYIDVHSGDKKIEICGKLGIVKAILDAERRSSLYIDPASARRTVKFTSLQETWYNEFFKNLTLNCRAEDLEQRLKSISFVIFNYDRCFETFLYYSLQNYYALSEQDAAKLCSELQVYHPYGKVGSPVWLNSLDQVAYGADVMPAKLLEIVKEIKTFTEGTDPSSSEIIAIRNCMKDANIIVFLGFAYHKLNLKLLTTDNHVNQSSYCHRIGSALGISESDCGVIKSQLDGLMPLQNGFTSLRRELSCVGLLAEYSRTIAISD